MADARPARDAVLAAMERRHNLTVALETALANLEGEVRLGTSSESAGWAALTQVQLTGALTECDSTRTAIVAAQAETVKLAAEINAEAGHA